MIYYPKDLSRTCEVSLLERQFCLVKDEALVPSGWLKDCLGPWCLGTHERLPVYLLKTNDNKFIGWVLGYPIVDGRVLIGPDIDLRSNLRNADASIDALYRELSGTFIVIHNSKVRLDAAGSLSAVYCKHLQMVASTPALIPYEDTDDDRGLIQAFGIPREMNWFPFGLTPRKNVFRLLPNHELSLEDFEVSRVWPTSKVEITPNVGETIGEISSLLKSLVHALTETGRPWMSLTGGMDSRVILACARNNWESLRLFTVDLKEEVSGLDCTLAEKIADRFGLNHRVFSFDEASEDELRAWMYRNGCCANAIGRWYGQRAFANLGTDEPYLTGHGSEVARGYYWHKSDTIDVTLSVLDLVSRMKLPWTDEVLRSGSAWLSSVASFDTYTQLDLLYIEQRLGCWCSVTRYSNPSEGSSTFMGFNSRRLYELFISLPVQYRRLQRLPIDLIRMNCPKLLTIPFNRVDTWRNRVKSRIKVSRLFPLLSAAMGR